MSRIEELRAWWRRGQQWAAGVFRPSTHPWVQGSLAGAAIWLYLWFMLVASSIAPGDNGVGSHIPPDDDLHGLLSWFPLFVGSGALVQVIRYRVAALFSPPAEPEPDDILP